MNFGVTFFGTQCTFSAGMLCWLGDSTHFPCSFFVPPNSRRCGERPKSSLVRTEGNHCQFQRRIQIIDALLYFKSAMPRRPKLGQILKHMTSCEKIHGRNGRNVESERSSISHHCSRRMYLISNKFLCFECIKGN